MGADRRLLETASPAATGRMAGTYIRVSEARGCPYSLAWHFKKRFRKGYGYSILVEHLPRSHLCLTPTTASKGKIASTKTGMCFDVARLV